MFKHIIVRITVLATTLFVAMVASAQSAFARILVDPGIADEIEAAAPSPSVDVLSQPWLVPVVVVVVGLVVVALAVVVVRRRHRMAHVLPA